MLQGQPITLEYKMSPGEVLEYHTQVDSEQSLKEEGQYEATIRSVLEMTMEQKVLNVTDGLAKIDVTIQEGKILREGETMELPAVGQTIQITMKRNGDIVKTSVDFPFSQPAFPERVLKVNDKWTGDSQMDIPLMDENGQQAGTKSVTLTYHYTLAGFDRVAGYDVALIQVECPQTSIEVQPEVNQSIVASGKTFFAHREGRLIKSNVETRTRITAPGAEVSTHIKVAVDLVNTPAPTGSIPNVGGGDEHFIIGA
jgi:hypothetical protein